jgi:hypothetical protein
MISKVKTSNKKNNNKSLKLLIKCIKDGNKKFIKLIDILNAHKSLKGFYHKIILQIS